MKKYVKTILEVTVLSEAPIDGSMSLYGIVCEMDAGEFIGGFKTLNVSDVPEDKIESELLAVGNDGSFFAMNEED